MRIVGFDDERQRRMFMQHIELQHRRVLQALQDAGYTVAVDGGWQRRIVRVDRWS